MSSRRVEKARLETLMGFVTFFAAAALLAAIVNLFQPEPSIWPGLFAAALLALDWWIWRAWRRR